MLILHLFPAKILAETISMTHSGMLHRLDNSTFYFYKLLLFQIFVLEIYKNLGHPYVLLHLQSTATQITISINIFICFNYYTVISQFFTNIHVNVFILKLDLNVKHGSEKTAFTLISCAMAIHIPFILFKSNWVDLKSINQEFILFCKSLNKQSNQ